MLGEIYARPSLDENASPSLDSNYMYAGVNLSFPPQNSTSHPLSTQLDSMTKTDHSMVSMQSIRDEMINKELIIQRSELQIGRVLVF